MADKKISQLPIGSLESNTIFPIVTNNITSQTTLADIQTALSGESSVGVWEAGTGENSVQTVGATNDASGNYSTAEGYGTISSGQFSHTEGYSTIASGATAHAEGDRTQAIGMVSHAGGQSTQAIGQASFVHGRDSIVNGNYSIVLGREIIGNQDNTTYVDNLNVRTLGSGTSVTNLGIDADGYVVSSSSSGGSSWTDYTPTMIGGFNVTSFTTTRAISKKEGEYVSLNISLNATTSGTIGSKTLTISLPYPIINTVTDLGNGAFIATNSVDSTSEKSVIIVQRDTTNSVTLFWSNEITTDSPTSMNISFMYKTNA